MKASSQWPIFRPGLYFEPTQLLQEFEKEAEKAIGPVLNDKIAWNGVCIYHENEAIWRDYPHKISLSDLPNLQSFINEYFDSEKIRMINIYKLEPGACLHPHRDMEGNLILGMIRVHYCLKTNLNCTLLGEHLEAGNFFCFSTSELHSAENLGSSDRIHLVVDLKFSKKNSSFYPKLTFSIFLTLLDRLIRILFLMIRDLIKRPSSIISRFKSLIKNKK